MAHERRRIALVAVLVVIGALVVAGGAVAGVHYASRTTTTTTTAPDPLAQFVPTINRSVAAAERSVGVDLPTRLGAAAPTLSADAFPTPLKSHQVVGFLPYWEVAGFTPDFASLTTLAYYAVDVGQSGALERSAGADPGLAALSSAAFASDVTAAHAAGTRVVLTVFSEDNAVLDAMASHPGPAAARLADAAAGLLEAHGLDGVDLDLEGTDAGAAAGFVRFVGDFAHDLHRIDAGWTIILNTYATSAFSPPGFFDVQALAPEVDELFVMAYDMQSNQVPGATAPLTGAPLSDALTLAEYTAIVPASRLVLGVPYYGYDFAASGPSPPATAKGDPLAVSYAAVVAAGHRPLWDPTTETPWTSFRRGKQWHQTYFDDPVSVALKTALAADFGCAGVGVWELGMSGGDPVLNSALLGGAAAVKLPLSTEPTS